MARFLLGFAIGTAIGAAAVLFGAPRAGTALRQAIGDLLHDTIEAGREAAVIRERELWDEFHKRLKAE